MAARSTRAATVSAACWSTGNSTAACGEATVPSSVVPVAEAKIRASSSRMSATSTSSRETTWTPRQRAVSPGSRASGEQVTDSHAPATETSVTGASPSLVTRRSTVTRPSTDTRPAPTGSPSSFSVPVTRATSCSPSLTTGVAALAGPDRSGVPSSAVPTATAPTTTSPAVRSCDEARREPEHARVPPTRSGRRSQVTSASSGVWMPTSATGCSPVSETVNR